MEQQESDDDSQECRCAIGRPQNSPHHQRPAENPARRLEPWLVGRGSIYPHREGEERGPRVTKKTENGSLVFEVGYFNRQCTASLLHGCEEGHVARYGLLLVLGE